MYLAGRLLQPQRPDDLPARRNIVDLLSPHRNDARAFAGAARFLCSVRDARQITMFRDQVIETIRRSELERLQLQRLQDTVRCVAGRVPFYQQKFPELGVKPEDIRSLADLRRLPFTSSADLRANYPTGLLAVPYDDTLRLHTSSGTTGNPKALFFSRQDRSEE